ncbi:hypothetical protein C1646_671166 [Rhizophagus diaphanus]|nr:hypothetical protein C1646_671166 [Rhizophagus diaphanus] [Rhizophagus sp. MUCL 43196]
MYYAQYNVLGSNISMLLRYNNCVIKLRNKIFSAKGRRIIITFIMSRYNYLRGFTIVDRASFFPIASKGTLEEKYEREKSLCMKFLGIQIINRDRNNIDFTYYKSPISKHTEEIGCHNEKLGGNDEWCIELIKQD